MPRKLSILSRLFALVLSLLLLPMVGAQSSQAIAAAPVQSVELFQTPKEVFGYQPVFIFVILPNTAQVSLRTTVEFVLTSDSLAINLLDISSPGEVTLASPMLPIPWARGWYMAAIPPLPTATHTFTLTTSGIIPIQTEVTLSVSTDVSYEVLVDGVAQAQGGYQVEQGTPARELAPVVYAMPSPILEGTDLVEETLGLGPKGWVWEGGQTFPALVMAFDDKGFEGLTSLKFEYQVMDGAWSTAALSESPLQKALREGVDAVNEATELIESGVQTFSPGFTMDRAFVPLFIGQAEIPAQPAGAYVRFRGTAEDVDGNSSISPAGLYYTVNARSDTRVLIIDPHVRNRVAQEALNEVVETVERNSRYGLPQEVAAGLEPLKQAGELAKKYGLTPFHHWELLGKTYGLHIVSPTGEPDRLLETFAPRVIVLSNLYLGLENGGYLGWDLRDLGVLDKLIDYVKTNHAGVVATHGTLSDWKVWLGAGEEERVKVGARGHVGEEIPADLNILEERTIAGLLGMPHLAIFEVARDAVAESLLADGPTYAVGLVVGSIPLQVPFVPFDGKLESTPEGNGHPLLVGLGDPFLISSSGPHEELGFEASTEVGWQLAMPQALALTAWKAAQEARPHVQKTGQRIAGLASEALEGAVSATEAARVEEAVDWGLDRIYSSIVSAEILPTAFRVSVDIPGVGKRDEVVSLAYEELMGLVPVKLVALSDRGLAGIVAHDKFYVEDGYRAVYISVEPEAGSGTTNAQLLANAIDWSKRWEYKDVLGLLGERVRAAKETVRAFQREAAQLKGEVLLTDDLLLNEGGHATLELNARAPGSFFLLIAHPTSPTVSVEVLEGDAVLAGIANVGPGVSLAEITAMQGGTLSIGLTAASDFSLNPAHVQATYAEEAEPTATAAATPTATAVTGLTPTPSATPTATPVRADGSAVMVTPTLSPTLTPTVTPTRTPTSAALPEQSATATLTPTRTVVGPPPPAPIAPVARTPAVAALQPTVAPAPATAAPIQPTPTATFAPVPEGGGAGCSLPGRSGSSGLDVGLLLLGGILLRLKVRQPKPWSYLSRSA